MIHITSKTETRKTITHASEYQLSTLRKWKTKDEARHKLELKLSKMPSLEIERLEVVRRVKHIINLS